MKCRTPNKRFGVMRGVCSQKVLREFESLDEDANNFNIAK